MPPTYQVGTPMSIQRRCLRKRSPSVKRERKLPRFTPLCFTALEHSRLGHAHAQEKQGESESAADEIRGAPVDHVRDYSADHRAHRADGGHGVEKDGTEEKLDASDPVAENSPNNPADQHAGHLVVGQEDAVVDELLPSYPSALRLGMRRTLKRIRS